ncbi:MAG: NERD domain-containing protein [Gammaproteobacteria bacterium]|nr:NERD domain-containing protein [Gammaproteobacteria bacterium]MDH3372778.1 NERD domain-containing protein [Gammaproteobacteria bacterium]MDH3408080.1 NERD domain-containing protein [Gammaproteobacteria bacterium]MDH3551635.1 NERD domain-containing protein [Gammaproteobacteria bacterium]
MLIRLVATSMPLIAVPVLAADAEIATGIRNVGPAAFIFTIAGALLLTLVFRSTASHAMRIITARIGSSRIRHALEARSTEVLHDFILPGAYGGLTKVDHALLTAGGILCIQTKHYNGIVFGGADEPQWTNVDGTRRRRFLNPLIQNEGRTRALQNVVPDVPVASVIVFTGRVEFPTPPPKNVIRVADLDSFIAKFVFGPSKVKDWDAAWLTVKSAALTDEATRKDLQAQIA